MNIPSLSDASAKNRWCFSCCGAGERFHVQILERGVIQFLIRPRTAIIGWTAAKSGDLFLSYFKPTHDRVLTGQYSLGYYSHILAREGRFMRRH